MSKLFPEFLCKMRCKRSKKCYSCFKSSFINTTLLL